MTALLQISRRMWQWKNFENRTVFDEVMCRLRWLTFFWPTLYSQRNGEPRNSFTGVARVGPEGPRPPASENKISKLYSLVNLPLNIRYKNDKNISHLWSPDSLFQPQNAPKSVFGRGSAPDPGLPWIWNFPSISISISTYFCVDIHGYIHIHRCLSCVHVATKFPQSTAAAKGDHSPKTKTKTFPS